MPFLFDGFLGYLVRPKISLNIGTGCPRLIYKSYHMCLDSFSYPIKDTWGTPELAPGRMKMAYTKLA